MSWYSPVTELTPELREKGLKVLTWESLSGNAMTLLVTGAFLPAMALALGAGNFMIGLLASFAPIAQMSQIPAILLVEKIGLRKLITVVFVVLSRVFLVAAALTPFFAPENLRAPLFAVFIMIFFTGGAFSGSSWASMLKDLIPEGRLGSVLASKLAAATALGAVISVAAGFSIAPMTEFFGDAGKSYGIVFLVASAFGLFGAFMRARLPEVRMPPRTANAGWISSLITPVKDLNFRRLLMFSAAWSFTVIMSGAFFTVYMLNRIGIPMSWVILLAVISQITNIYFFKVWGRIADRFSNKSVLAVSVPMFIVLLLLYPFTTMPERYSLTVPLLVLIHVIGGVSTAGFNLCAANIALRLAPHGAATAYLGTNAFCAGLSAAIAPVIGGLIGSYYATKEISIEIFYRPDSAELGNAFIIPALSFRGIDFVFFAAAITGLYAWHRLSLIDEEGTVSENAVREEVFTAVRNSFLNTSGLSMGMRRMTAFPYDLLRKTTTRNPKPTPPNNEPSNPAP